MIRIFRAIPVESLRLIVFDLDGTLIDSRLGEKNEGRAIRSMVLLDDKVVCLGKVEDHGYLRFAPEQI